MSSRFHWKTRFRLWASVKVILKEVNLFGRFSCFNPVFKNSCRSLEKKQNPMSRFLAHLKFCSGFRPGPWAVVPGVGSLADKSLRRPLVIRHLSVASAHTSESLPKDAGEMFSVPLCRRGRGLTRCGMARCVSQRAGTSCDLLTVSLSSVPSCSHLLIQCSDEQF